MGWVLLARIRVCGLSFSGQDRGMWAGFFWPGYGCVGWVLLARIRVWGLGSSGQDRGVCGLGSSGQDRGV